MLAFPEGPEEERTGFDRVQRHDRAGFQPVDIIPFVEVEIDDVKITRDDVFVGL